MAVEHNGPKMNGLMTFENAEFGSVRTLTINEEPYFVGKDVCQVFGDKNHNRSIGRVDTEDKVEHEIIDALGRKQKAILVNESGLYTLLFTMRPQKANKDGVSDAYPIQVTERIEKLHRFKRWVTSEVLPSIRKHGMWATDDILNNPDVLIAVATELKKEKELRKALEETVLELQPKANYYDIVLNCPDLVPISVIAKDYGWTANQLNKYLKDKKVQFRQKDIWLLYKKYAEKGYTSTKTFSYEKDGETRLSIHTYWTQKGRLFIYHLLESDGVLPIVERENNETKE